MSAYWGFGLIVFDSGVLCGKKIENPCLSLFRLYLSLMFCDLLVFFRLALMFMKVMVAAYFCTCECLCLGSVDPRSVLNQDVVNMTVVSFVGCMPCPALGWLVYTKSVGEHEVVIPGEI